ncbi:MAG: 5'-nucleotidase C-terminal domain-containing protein [Prevotella sp.]|nr:5'-nucleotidase C-terminal domain-containing protein [Prevotella sp.]
MRLKSLFLVMVAVMALSACTTHYAVSQVTRTRLLVDKSYDKPMSAEVASFMDPYMTKVGELMSSVLGRTPFPLTVERPESPLGNLLPDVLVWSGKFYGEKPDFGIYNLGGIRASLAQGDITIGDVYSVAPFENKVCFLTLSGEKVLELMSQIASRGGEGVSREVRMVITANRQLRHATIGGREIDPTASYRVATVDYVSQGNNGMVAFKSSTDVRIIPSDDALTRELMMKYIKERTAAGQLVESAVEGRIIVEE